MRQRKRRSVAKHRYFGLAIGAALFICLPALLVAGVVGCASDQAGLHCSIVKLAFDHGPPVKQLRLEQATTH